MADPTAIMERHENAPATLERPGAEPRRNPLTDSQDNPKLSRYAIDPDTGCWIWQGAVSSSGYGSLWANKKSWGAHRYYYEQFVGPIPAGLQLDHLCRIKLCVNPSHLEPVAPQENTHRGKRVKLDAEAAAYVKASTEQGRVLAERFGVTDAAISHIRHGRTWK